MNLCQKFLSVVDQCCSCCLDVCLATRRSGLRRKRFEGMYSMLHLTLHKYDSVYSNRSNLFSPKFKSSSRDCRRKIVF